MPMEETVLGDQAATNGKVASHRFLGAHTWLAAMRDDQSTLERTQAFLKGVASVDVAAVVLPNGSRHIPADGADVSPGDRVRFDVVIRNRHVGHRFPGGVMDAQDTWVELAVRDQRGNVIAEAGGDHETSGDDPTAHVLRSAMVGEDGRPLWERQTNRFRAGVFNHTLLPRETAVVQFDLTLPSNLTDRDLPISVTATLKHRTRNLHLGKLSCEASENARGKAFRGQHAKSDLNACTPQPVTEIDTSTVWVGSGWESEPTDHLLPTWQRVYEHGLAWLRALQERIDEGRPSLVLALDLVEQTGSYHERAMVLSALGMLAAKEGRTEEALAWLGRAEVYAPNHPALAYLRGLANAEVWRWEEAAKHYSKALPAAGYDDRFFMELALARGSSGDEAGALWAAQMGLSIQPRDADMLRIQALSLRGLGANVAQIAAAEQAYSKVLVADMVPVVRARCSAKVEGCAEERNPAHHHSMRAK